MTTSPELRPETETFTAAAGSPSGTSARSSVAELLRQALDCERRGMDSERQRLLELAAKADPANETVRGLLGHVQLDGRWLTPAQAAARERAGDERAALLAEYETRRAAAADTASAQWKLALWCERQGLKAEATAHFTQVTRLNPANRAAWHHLGCRLYQGRWMNEEQIAAEEAESRSRTEADQYWRPLLTRWKGWLMDPAREGEATRELSQVRDPRAVAPVLRVFDGGTRWQRWAVYLLGRIDSPQSAQALATLAFTAPTREIREAAIRRLRAADPRAYVGFLINGIRQPTRYEVEWPARGNPDALVRIDEPQAEIERHYRPVRDSESAGPLPGQSTSEVTRLLPNGHYGFFNQQVRVSSAPPAREAERAIAAVNERVTGDLQAIDMANLPIKENNLRILHALYQLTGKAFGENQDAWTTWWNDQLGYRYGSTRTMSKPVIVQEVSATYTPPPPTVTVTQSQVTCRPHSCFAAGTPVVTRAGHRAIETLKIGDQVLTQDTTTGALAYQPVLAVFHNPPSEVLSVELDSGEPIVATDIHRFWQTGKGWRMTRELEPGDHLRLVGGTARVIAVVREPRQLVYNLEVAGPGDFFVGTACVLVHDVTMATPVDKAFDGTAAPHARATIPVAGH